VNNDPYDDDDDGAVLDFNMAETNTMSDKINQAVWREQGWVYYKASQQWCLGGIWRRWDEMPQYATDLNSCAELRAELSEGERAKYILFLIVEITGEETPEFESGMGWLIANATAEQHCKAFLAAKGLTVEDQP
jgi:hypothetical protein